MPIYEYKCQECLKPFQVLVMKPEEEKRLICPKCGSSSLSRLISRVAYHVSESSRLEAFDPASTQNESFCRDIRNIGLYAKKRAQQMGVDLGAGFESKLEKLRTDPGSVLEDSE